MKRRTGGVRGVRGVRGAEEAEEAEEEAGAGASDETGSSKRSRPDARELDSSGDEIPPKRPSKRKC